MVDHQPGAWGYGKIHAQMVEGPCGEVYASTYWGTRRDLVYDRGYTGDLLLRLDPAARTTSVLGVPVPGHGTPSMGGSSALGLLYGEATDPASEPDAGLFFVHDVATGETTIVDDSADHVGFRSLAVDADGRALFTMPAGHVTRYDPATNELDARSRARSRARSSVPSPRRRRTARSTASRRIRRRSSPSARTARSRHLGEAPGYIASLAMEPDGSRRLLRARRPRRRLERSGTPLMALDTATGEQRRRRRAQPAGRVGPRTDSRRHVLASPRRDAPPPVRRPQRRPGRDARGDDLRRGRADGDHAARRRGPTAPSRLARSSRVGDPSALTCWSAPIVAAGLRRHGAVGGRHGDGRARRRVGGHDGPRRRMGRRRCRRPGRPVPRNVRRPPARRVRRPGCRRAGPDALLLGDGAHFVDSGTAFEPGRTSAAVVRRPRPRRRLDLVRGAQRVRRSPAHDPPSCCATTTAS